MPRQDIEFPYAATTRDITVRVLPAFIDDKSNPDDNHYVWAYHVRVENHGRTSVQLMTRHWIIADAHGRIQEVKGDGVVGEQPILEPSEAYEYTSGCPLSTPSGIMRGSYGMVDDAGRSFDIDIPAFSLDSPYAPHTLN
ncbi:Co2+/Mg2+ efflux protein ApaG [Parapedomonas caeni]